MTMKLVYLIVGTILIVTVAVLLAALQITWAIHLSGPPWMRWLGPDDLWIVNLLVSFIVAFGVAFIVRRKLL